MPIENGSVPDGKQFCEHGNYPNTCLTCRRQNTLAKNNEKVEKKKITEAEYNEVHEMPAGTGSAENVYGARLLDVIDGMDKTAPDYTARKNKILDGCRKNLVMSATGKLEFNARPEYLKKAVYDIFAEGLTKEMSPDELVESLSDGKINNAALEGALRVHREKMQAREKEIKEKYFETYKENFLRDMELFFENNQIPFAKDAMRNRLDRVSFKMIDTLKSLQNSKVADYDISLEEVRVADNPFLDPKYFRHFISHELTHAIDGRTYLQSNDLKVGKNEKPVRGGLQFEQKTKDGAKETFVWLNEGVTEAVTMELGLIDQDKSPSYPDEIRLIALLLTKGNSRIDKQKLYQAYFENGEETESRAVKELIRAVNEAYQPGFLNRLNSFVEEHGVNMAVELMTNDWKQIYEQENLKKAA